MSGVWQFLPILVILSSLSSSADQAELLDISQFGEGAIHADGSLSEQGIIQILRKDGLLPDLLFERAGSAPKLDSVLIKETPLKLYGKIYQIKVNHKYLGNGLANGLPNSLNDESDQFTQIFVIKYCINSEHDETELLSLVQNSQLTKLPMRDLDYPRLCLYEKTYRYSYQSNDTGKNGEISDSHSFMISHSAKGKMVHEFLLELLASLGMPKNPKTPLLFALTKRAFNKSGKALAKIHLKFSAHPTGPFKEMKTVIHGDYHSENIFFDPKGDRIYLIDNADLGKSILNPQGVDFRSDIKDFVAYVSEQETEDSLEVIKQLYESFVEGYVSVFPASRQTEVKRELQLLVTSFRVKT